MYTYEYPHPAVTADNVVFGFDGKNLHILLIERGIEPYKGEWALPGGFMRIEETIEECAKRELYEETGLTNIYLEQFHTFSKVGRDPRERVVTVAFIALVKKSDYKLIAGDDAANAKWFTFNELPPLAFDHEEIIAMARRQLTEMLKTRPIAFQLLDNTFSIPELQNIYEVINDTVYDRRNFARKMTSSGYIRPAGKANQIHPDIIEDRSCFSAESRTEIVKFRNAPLQCKAEPRGRGRIPTLFSFLAAKYDKDHPADKYKKKNPFNP